MTTPKPTAAALKARQAIIAKLGNEKPVTFESLKRWKFKRPDRRVSTGQESHKRN